MKTHERLLLLFIPLVLLVALLLLVPIAYASPPTDGGGTFTDKSLIVTPVNQADGNTIVNLATITELTGTLTGTAVGDFRCLIRSTGEGTCHGGETFTGTVCIDTDCRSGTAVIHDVIKLDGALAQGRFTILRGTGGLANLRGLGTFEGVPGAGGTYTVQAHFDPS